MGRPKLDAPDTLDAGTWEPDGRGVLRWSPAEVPSRFDVRLLVACPTCRAHVHQTCHSISGNPRLPHVTRLAPRLCPCGALVERKKQLCEPCRVEARLQTYRQREARRPTRTRRRSAAA